MRIVTVTLNPALDKTVVLDELRPGELNRLRDVVVDVGGKGINVSKMIAALGGDSLATGFVGGGTGGEIVRALDGMGIRHDFVRIAVPTRTNTKVLDRGSRLTELNEPGPTVGPAEFAALADTLTAAAGPYALFVFSGSLTNGVGPDSYRKLLDMVKPAGATTFLDADGEAFRQAVEAGPAFIKPNRFELFQYFGQEETDDMRNVAGLCRRLLDRGVGRIAVSMGADGALFVSPDDAFLCPGLPVAAHSSVGAGDSMVGAIAYGTATGMPWRDTARLAMATSAGAVTTVGTKPPERSLVDELAGRVTFTDL
ncbi:MAG: 1-phosphofructokinase family hexose kinase [Planctomycetes bacterium]|nr:1-phosphofructokinase family hexose kinase [Planctomycetota bacterium]